MKLKSTMPKSLILKTPSTVIEANIPIKKSKRSSEAGGTGTEESKTRRTHRQRMKAFLAARSVA